MIHTKHRSERGQVAAPTGFHRPWGATYIGVLLALVALVIAIVVWASTGDGWTKDKITLEFVLIILAILL